MSKLFLSILLVCVGGFVHAGDQKEIRQKSLSAFKRIDIESPWLQSGNGAGLSQMIPVFPSEVKLNFGQSEGDLHSVFSGRKIQSYNFSSQSYKKIKRTFLYGSFDYTRSFERGLNFSNTVDPAVNYPYLLADTIGNDIYDREFFSLKGIIASPVSSNFDWGLNVDYRVGIAAQNRDPRTENNVMRANVSPGLLYKNERIKLGVNLTYGYYNEDIDVSVVEVGAEQTLFQLHGLGEFGYHESSSFFRLYQQNQIGGGLQFECKAGGGSNNLHTDYLYFNQTIDDGRKGSTATWAVVKNDAKVDGIKWNLKDIYSVVRGEKLHQLIASVEITNKLGTEFIQRLEKVSATDLEHWITYAKEQKYYSLQTNVGLNYKLMHKDDDQQMKSLFSAELSYSAFDEKYYLPEWETTYSNLVFASSFLKLFAFRGSDISAEVKFKYQFNIDRRQNLDSANFIVQKIFLPEYNYLTKDYIAPGITVAYQIPAPKTSRKYFIKSDLDWYHSANSLNRTVFSVSAGLIF